MVWTLLPLKHVCEIIDVSKNGNSSSYTQEYTHKYYDLGLSTDFNVGINPSDKELILRPHSLETLKKRVNMDYPNGVITQLFVGILDENEIAYLGKIWIRKTTECNYKKMNQYFFDDGKPSGDILPQRGTLPSVFCGRYDDKIIQHFNTLLDIRPAIADSLERCIAFLKDDGHDYSAVNGKLSSGLHYRL